MGEAFDRVILYEDHYTRGRADGEIIRLLREGMAAGSRVKQIEEIRGAVAAVEAALRSARPGELMLVQADTIDETVQCVRHYVESITPEPVLAAEELGLEDQRGGHGAGGLGACRDRRQPVGQGPGDCARLCPSPPARKRRQAGVPGCRFSKRRSEHQPARRSGIGAVLAQLRRHA